MKKFAAMLLAVALLWSCTASLVTARATSVSDSANELHFIIRHWHTKDDASNSQFQGGSLDSSGDRYFVVVEGYIVPNADPIGNRNYEFYMVCQSDTTIDNEYYKKGDRVLIHNSGEVGVNGSAYIEELDHEHGVITLSTNQLSKDHSDDDAEVFSSYSVSAGHDTVQTKGARMTITYKENIHLVKAHAFYVKTTVDTEDGTQDDTVFGSGGISGSLEQDTAMVYTYKEKKEGMDGHEKGEIVKVKGQPFTGFKKDKYGNHLMDADGLFIMDEAALKAVGINPDDVVVTKVYDSGKGLHTDKTASISADPRFYVDVLDQEGNPTGVKGPDGRTFDLDLETWHSEGFAPQIGMVLDASGSMAFASDTPKAIKVEDGTALYDSLKHKIGTYNSNFKMEDDFIAKHLVGYYEFRNNNDGNNRTWYLNSKKYANTTINYNELRQHLDYFAKLVVQSTDDNEIDFSAANQRTLIAYDDGGYYSGSWGNVPANFNGTYLALNLAGDWLANKSQGSGFLLESATEFEESDFTLSFTLKQTKETNPGDVEILYIGEETGTRSDSSYFHVIRRNNDIVVSCAANGEETTLFSLPTGFGNGVQRVITFVFKNNSVTAYVDGVEKAKASVPNLSHEAIVFAPFKNRSTTATEFWLDSVCLFDAALDEGEIYALTSLHSSKAVTGSNATGATIAEMKAITSIDAFLTPGELALLMNPNKTDNSIFGWAGYSYFVYNPAGGNNLGYVPLGYYNYGANGATPGNSSRLGGEGWYYISSTGWANVKNGNSKAYNGLAGGTYKDEITAREAALPSTANVNGGTAPDADENFVPKNTSSTYNATANGPAKFYIDGDGYLRCFYGVNNTACITSYVYELDDSEYIRTEALQRALGLFVTQLDERSPASRVSAVRFSGAAATSDKLFLLDWTDEPSKSTGMLSLGQDDINVYKYILTGGTDTAKGLTAYREKLQSGDNPYGDAGEPPKYLIIFTDGSDDNIKSPGNIQNIAKQLKDDDYTIYTVLLDGGTMGTTQYGEVEEFLTSLAGTKDTSTKEERSAYFYSTHKAREEDEESKYDDVSDADVLTQVFVNDILDRVIEPLEDYEIKDYIDPRFDLVDEDGTVWHLNAGGEVKKELANGNTEVLPKLTENVGVEFHLTDHSDEEARKPCLRYNAGKDMYYLVWTDQTIHSNAVGANRLPVWNVRVTIRAKDDFLGGNAVLSNGNEAKMNYVYATGDANASSGANRANPDENDNYPASKGFPRTAVNVTPQKEELDLTQIIYMGEELYSTKIAEDLIRTSYEQAVGIEKYYWEYLERFVTYFNKGDNVEQLEALHAQGLVTDRLLSAAKKEEEYARTEGLTVTLLTSWMIGDKVNGLTLPYIYLPDKSVSNAVGTGIHKSDVIGQLNYKIHDMYSNADDKDNREEYEIYPDDVTKDARDRKSRLSVTYTSDESVERMAWNNAHVVKDTDYKRDPAYKPVPGETAPEKILIEGDFDTEIVSGEIAMQVSVAANVAKKLKNRNLSQAITYTADLCWDGSKVGTFRVEINPASLATTGDNLLTAQVTYNDYQGYMMTAHGLPLGAYTLQNGKGANIPSGFGFTAGSAITSAAAYESRLFDRGTGNNTPEDYIAATSGNAFILGQGAQRSATNARYTDYRFGLYRVTLEEQSGDLLIHKRIKDEDGADASRKQFTFKVTGPIEAKGLSYDLEGGGSIRFSDDDEPVATVTVTGQGDVRIKDLPFGAYKVEELRDGIAVDGYELEVDGEGSRVIRENDETVEVTVTNTYIKKFGDLTIQKLIAGDVPEEAAGKEYTFTITGPDLVKNQTYDGLHFDAEGKATVTVTGASSVTVSRLPVGRYTVTEDRGAAGIAGYDLTITEESNDVIVTSDATNVATVTVTNTYTVQPGSLTIQKKIEGDAPTEVTAGKVYSFTIIGPAEVAGKTYALKRAGSSEEPEGTEEPEATEEPEDGEEPEATATSENSGSITFSDAGEGQPTANVTITGEGSVTIEGLPEGEYTVSELVSSAELDDYTVNVGYDPAQGMVSISKGGTATVTVTNTYALKTGGVTISKTVGVTNGELTPADRNQTFTFEITLSESISGEYSGVTFEDGRATVELKHGESKEITGLPTGITYTIVEAAVNGYTADEAEQTGVIPDGGSATADFVNRRIATGGVTISKTVEVTNGELTPADRNQTFTFEITLSESISGEYSGVTFEDGKATVELKHGESKEITGLPTGITYTIVEAAVNGYTADEEEQTGVIPDGGSATADFVNRRMATGELTVSKVIVGGETDASNQTYRFTITGPDAVKGQSYGDVTFDADGKATVLIVGAGSVTITGLPAGTYNVTEDRNRAELNGYTLEVSGEGNVNVTSGGSASATVTNSYTKLPEPTDTSTPEPTDTSTPEPTDTSTPEPTDTSTPEPTDTSTPEPTDTATPEPTDTSTPEPTDTSTPEPTDTSTPEPTGTSTPEPTDTYTPEPTDTSTPEPTDTSTPEPTDTSTPEPTDTSTPEPTDTSTPGPTGTSTPEPTDTSTPEPTDTSTPEPTSTSTPEPTSTSTPEPTDTSTPEPTDTSTPEPTDTSTPEPTDTSTPEPTDTSTPEPTDTSTPEPTDTSTPGPTDTSTPEATDTSTPGPTDTSTPEPTDTSTPGPTGTSTPGPTDTSMPGPTGTSTPEPTDTSTPEPTDTSTPGPTDTSTPEPTDTSTPEPTSTSAPEPTGTSTPEPTGTPTSEPMDTPTSVPTDTLAPEPTGEPTPEPSAEPQPGSGNLIISKTVTGSGGDKTLPFSFVVMLSDRSVNGVYGDISFYNGTGNFTLKHGESKTAAGLPEGVRYSVSEISAAQSGYAVTSMNEQGVITAGDSVEVLFVNAREETDVPQTGDNSHLELWMALAIMAMLGMASSIFVLYRETRKKPQ